ncbi:hypothetical protein MPTK2_7g12030 [Marchantia polymorpha subsp. ruderalis]
MNLVHVRNNASPFICPHIQKSLLSRIFSLSHQMCLHLLTFLFPTSPVEIRSFVSPNILFRRVSNFIIIS